MVFYLRARKLDIKTGDAMVATIHQSDAELHGIRPGQDAQLAWGKEVLMASIDVTESAVNQGEIGFFSDVWETFEKRHGDPYEIVEIRLVSQPDSIEFIKKKLKGNRLNYEEMFEIMKDISSRRLGTIETTYFAACGYNPGFNKDEIYFATKAMAETGDMLRFEGEVADKHSIGGVPGKGVTPIVIPIVASAGLMVPNTSTRAITSASATTDMLEYIMPMVFSKEQIESMVMKAGACMVWGGGLELAPADDEMIRVEKPLKIESFDKFVISIMAKKVAPGIKHLLLDIPYGPGTKVKNKKDLQHVKELFKYVASKFAINVRFYTRQPDGPDGNALGPALECREFLRVIEQHDERSLQLEKISVEMAGELLELAGKAKKGKGVSMARKILSSGDARKKLLEIVELQGGDPNVNSNSIKLGKYTHEIHSEQDGVIKFIDNKKIMDVARGLGNPHVKDAGMYLHKKPGDEVKKGDLLVTLYASNQTRLAVGVDTWSKVKVYHF